MQQLKRHKQLFQAEQNLRDRKSSITQNQGELQQAIAAVARLQAELTQREAEGRKIQHPTRNFAPSIG